MRAAFYTLGCKVNQYETDCLITQFATDGFDIVPHWQVADVYVVNSCTVTASGDKKSLQMLRRLRGQNPHAIVCLCGCFPQAFPEQASLVTEADIITGSNYRTQLLELVHLQLEKKAHTVQINPHNKDFELLYPSQNHKRTRALVKIQDGCERYCAYCIIPTARGPVRSKPLDVLKEELKSLADAGYLEVVLVGINLSCYGQDTGKRLVDAVKIACNTAGIKRVRLGSLEPELLCADDIKALAAIENLCPQFHLSLQSGCDSTLIRMNRQYDTATYREIVQNLRSSFKNCAITTDIMVGFPGETLEEHAQSLQFCAEIGFAQMHVFSYSPRPGTAAANFDGQVAETDKQSRNKQMLELAKKSRAEFLLSQIGMVCPVLFERPAKTGICEGYTKNYTPVKVLCNDNLHRQLINVKILQNKQDFCLGTIA